MRSARRSIGLFDCQNGVYVDVKTFTSFGNVTMTNPVDANGNFVRTTSPINPAGPATSWSCGCSTNGRSIVSLLGFNLSNMSGGKRLLVATAAFRNEPYAS